MKTSGSQKSKSQKSKSQKSKSQKSKSQKSKSQKSKSQKSKSQKSKSQKSKSPSELIDARIKELGDWRGKMLSRLRTLVKQADPEVVEEWKWIGVPVWSHDGVICTGVA